MSSRWCVNEDTGCWEWQLFQKGGYGRLTWNGVRGYRAHRWSYEQHVGPIPKGLTVDHLCFNTLCVNPEHLRLLTHSANAANRREAMKTACARNHPFTDENTYIRPNGHRTCRTCNREAVARYRSRSIA